MSRILAVAAKIRISGVGSAWQGVCRENRKQTAHFLADHSEDTHVTQQGSPQTRTRGTGSSAGSCSWKERPMWWCCWPRPSGTLIGNT